MWSYPQGPGEFATTQLFFAVKDVGLILGLMALWWCGAVPRTRLGRIGRVVTMSGMVGLTITEVLAIIPLRQTVDSTAAGTMGALYGLGTIVVGVGLIIAGIAAARDGAWTGWRRWLPLVLGVWLFVPTMPALFLDFTAARLAPGRLGAPLRAARLGPVAPDSH
ncbi:hypothetical protein [Nocardioides sp. B-3]|uniref:hypothetical protein n=1 Tax=Nocardioides sp. B-3 TaxID=2895565 RepID=UPI0021529635|nr:hypothetical protein [Nocardioides sp. B-3]UUZ61536.1 hypothetical protein LP418_13850 [Nocardioides sp. B-3]